MRTFFSITTLACAAALTLFGMSAASAYAKTASNASDSGTSSAGSLTFSAPRLGSGFVRPTREHSVFVNPAALADAPVAVEGGWSFDRRRPLIEAVGNYRTVGFGGGYRRDGMANVLEAGVGLNITDRLAAGLAFNMYDKDIDSHLALTYFALNNVQLGFVARFITSGVTRLDFGGAYVGRGFGAEFDYKQVIRDGEHSAFFNFGASTQIERVGLLLGIDWILYKGDWRGGAMQAGVSFDLLPRWTLRASYRPEPYESGQGDWLLALLAKF